MSNREYELLLIVKPDIADDEQSEILNRVIEIIDGNGGRHLVTDAWGKRKLAYEIEDYTKGFYSLIHFVGSNATLDELHHRLSIEDRALRQIVHLVDEAPDLAAREVWAQERMAEIETREAEEATRREEEATRQDHGRQFESQDLAYLGD